MTNLILTQLPTGGVLVGIDYPTIGEFTQERAESLHSEGIPHDTPSVRCPICDANSDVLAQDFDSEYGGDV